MEELIARARQRQLAPAKRDVRGDERLIPAQWLESRLVHPPAAKAPTSRTVSIPQALLSSVAVKTLSTTSQTPLERHREALAARHPAADPRWALFTLAEDCRARTAAATAVDVMETATAASLTRSLFGAPAAAATAARHSGKRHARITASPDEAGDDDEEEMRQLRATAAAVAVRYAASKAALRAEAAASASADWTAATRTSVPAVVVGDRIILPRDEAKAGPVATAAPLAAAPPPVIAAVAVQQAVSASEALLRDCASLYPGRWPHLEVDAAAAGAAAAGVGRVASGGACA